jgi:flagellar basal body P-ring formation protein FlgA
MGQRVLKRYFAICPIIVILLSLFPGPSPALQEGSSLEAEKIVEILENHLQKAIGDSKRRIEVKEVRGFGKMVLPSGPLTWEVILPEQAFRGGNVTATLIFFLDSKEVKKIRVTARVDIYTDVVIARHFLKRHHVLEESDLEWANRNISALPPDVVIRFDEILGKRTTLSVNGYEVLRRTNVERTPLIKKGDRIIMCVETDRFRITTMGEAQEEGGRGERIKLVNLSSRKEVYGKVLTSNSVQVEY